MSKMPTYPAIPEHVVERRSISGSSILEEFWEPPQNAHSTSLRRSHINRDELAAYLRYFQEHRSMDNMPISPDTSQNSGSAARSAGCFDESEIDVALDLVVKLMFVISITHDPTSISAGTSRVDWEDGQSLEHFMQEMFPTYSAVDLPTTRIKTTKLRASYLEAYADIEISWTDHLCDHLSLSTSEHRKVLKVFGLPCLLEASYGIACKTAKIIHDEKVLAHQTIDDGTNLKFLEVLNMGASLERGYFPPTLLLETLMTFRILFPTHDAQWLRQRMRPKFRWPSFSTQHGSDLDERLAFPFEKEGAYKRPLINRRELYQRFPHWALRLDILYEEAEDPTPISWAGRWSERKKGARHSFWVTFGVFVVAIMFGVTTTLLGAVQLWVAFCDWRGGDGGRLCRR
ncbi:hypothetical protein AB5N19_03373 [Seiridium cardinale]